ncbi:MAG TPA: putative quinol monooxygenase [Edaphobacter sp.]
MESEKSDFIVIAEFEVSAAHRAEFLTLCEFDSKQSVSNEPGCQKFDLLTSDEAPESVVLFEVYDDRGAFDFHLTTPHYATFAEGVQRLGVTKKNVRFFGRRHV